MTPDTVRYTNDLLLELIKSVHALESLVCFLGIANCGILLFIWSALKDKATERDL